MNTSQSKRGPGKNYIGQAWLVLLLSLFFGAALAGVQITLGPTITENKINETRQKVPEMVLGVKGAQTLTKENKILNITAVDAVAEKDGKTVHYSVLEARMPGGSLAGWVVKLKGQGYAGKIELLLGLDPKVERITGLFVLEQKETPGLGNKIITQAWRSQFAGKPTGKDLVAVKTGAKAPNEIDAVTGATISSRSVCSIINKAQGDLKSSLAEKAAKEKKNG